MKHIKKPVAILIVLTLFLSFALGVMADGTKKGGKTTTTTSAQTVEPSGDSTSSEIDLSKASS